MICSFTIIRQCLDIISTSHSMKPEPSDHMLDARVTLILNLICFLKQLDIEIMKHYIHVSCMINSMAFVKVIECIQLRY